MGKLVFDIGTTTAIRNVGNVQAEKILNDFIELNEGPVAGNLARKARLGCCLTTQRHASGAH